MKTIRFVQENDASDILKIYTPYIDETAITFEFETPTLMEFADRIRNISAEYPYIVCFEGEKMIGYAYAHRHMERAAYQWNAELSVYLDQNYLSQGVGSLLYKVLIELLQMQNVHNVYGCVTMPNENSERLHGRLGFKTVGIYHNAGYKCGLWHDVAWYEKEIAQYEMEPEPFMPIEKVEKERLLKVLDTYTALLNS